MAGLAGPAPDTCNEKTAKSNNGKKTYKELHQKRSLNIK